MTKGMSIVVAIGFIATGCVSDISGSSDSSGSDPSTGGPAPTGHNYEWVADDFSACSMPCGGGTQIRRVECIAPDGSVAPDSACSGLGAKPGGEQACNPQSCSNTSCTPAGIATNPETTAASTAITGTETLTVTLDIDAQSAFTWDHVDFGDGETFPSQSLSYKSVGGGSFACVTHTFVEPGTYSVGRAMTGSDTVVELTVTVIDPAQN
jgi:hypothetical protein